MTRAILGMILSLPEARAFPLKLGIVGDPRQRNPDILLC
jgi:hypothetical protein